jgi:cytochrome c-type biogenesis protein
MERLFAALNEAMQSSVLLALGGAFAWGVLSVVLSPCHLSSIPLVIAFIGETGGGSTRRAFALAALFGLGILVTIAAIGAATAALGRMLGDLGPYGNYAIALIFLVLGLHFLGLIPMPWSGGGPRGTARKGLLAAFVLGLVFGVALGPCTFAFMAPMLGVAFKVATTSWVHGAALLLIYGIGHCAVIVAAGTSAEKVQRYLDWNERSRGGIWLRRACGVLVLLGGVYLIFTAR